MKELPKAFLFKVYTLFGDSLRCDFDGEGLFG
jgi:hypothetical protein